MLPKGMESVADPGGLKEYTGVFIHVNSWKQWERADLEINNVVKKEQRFPDFVIHFEQRLDRAPYVPDNVRFSLT